MTTEYRRGIPSTAHVEAATRLGLLWGDNYSLERRWHFEIRDGVFHSNFESPSVSLGELRSGPGFWIPPAWVDLRPIHPDGTPVDWEWLDWEVARAGQPQTVATAPAQPQGFRADLWARINRHFTLERVSALTEIQSIDNVCIRTRNWQWGWGTADREAPTQQQRADILARWTVYQELKPLYDLVDGAQGEAAMPRDVQLEWSRIANIGDPVSPTLNWRLCRDYVGELLAVCNLVRWSSRESSPLANPLRNFATVLDAVAERRVSERMRAQAPAPTVHRHNWIYDGLGGGHNGQYVHNCACGERDWFADPMSAPSPREAVVRSPPIQEPRRVNVEPRRFADVRPDRHEWRWWRIAEYGASRFEALGQQGFVRWLYDGETGQWFTPTTLSRENVIPTDEQGNPVSWESIGPTDPTEMRYQQALAAEGLTPGMPNVPAGTAQTVTVQASPGRVYDVEWVPTNTTIGTLRDVHTARIRQLDRFVAEAIQAGNQAGFSIESPTPPRPGQFSNNPAAPPLTPEGLLAAMQNYAVPGIHVTVGTGAKPVQTEAITTLPLPLPRFTTNELDDVDHSKTTKLDEVTLRRGKLPTVEQIAKYREVRARRTGGTVADALKESRIDCEVAQYVLERWASGLGDEESRILIETASRFGAEHKAGTHLPAFAVDSRIQWYTQNNQTLDTSEKPSSTVQRERQEAEERRQRLAELRQRLAAERAAQSQEPAKESEAGDAVSRLALIEPDPQADPAASIRVWEARQAAAKVRPVAVPPRIVKPATAPRRPAIEVVDAEMDGLSRSEVVTALFGRALNGGC